MPAQAINYEQLSDDTHLRAPQIASKPGRPGLFPVSEATWWRWVRTGLAPAPVRLGPGVTAWRMGALRAFSKQGVQK